MKIVSWEPNYRSPYLKTVLTAGNFDGVHLGHQAIFSSVIAKARELSAIPAVLTFNPHPQHFFRHGEPPLITTFEKRLKLIESHGIEAVFVAGKNREFYDQDAETFVRGVLLDSLKMAYIFVGHDFTFGKGKTGTIDLLTRLGEQYDFGVEEKSAVVVQGMLVSSTMVRNLIQMGRIKDASVLLGRDFSISGQVVRGVGRGRQLGYPTANIDYKGRLMPLGGVYVTWVVIDGRRYWGVANLGSNLTFGARNFTIEVHILDFDEDIYDKVIEVGFIDRIRHVVKFSGPDELVRQIRDDITLAERIIKSYEARL
ncbi:MAG: bifunctional riboflavin kinase/FAD synthetase [Deltaproteobacteria bacterium]|nr:bifunctional riboflavin kinase/FAD synthetase [Candidatus Zymogenaceae bacterium]